MDTAVLVITMIAIVATFTIDACEKRHKYLKKRL